jgi:ribulose 1,5-bisphosphate synthetase/thiazole synthase
MATIQDMRESIKLAAREIIEWNAGMNVEQLDDAIAEQSDSLVNVYTRPCVEEWLAAGMPTLDEYGIESSGEIFKDIMAAMFFWYENELREVLAELLGE